MDDLISRQAVIEAVIAEGRNVDSRYLESERIIHESDAVEALSMLPSAQPERKEGHWIRWYETKTDDYGELYIPHCKCSECGKEYDPYLANTVIYCMRCGVKMKGEENA